MSKKLLDTFKVLPPKRCTRYAASMYVFDSLDAVVDDWIARFGAKGKWREERDTCVQHCIAAIDFGEAVMRACSSLRTNGKLHNHQSRVRKADRDYFAVRILKQWPDQSYPPFSTFDNLYDFLDDIKPRGIGPVTVYDVATRIAAYMKMPINSLYLHAGVQVGWNLLHGGRGNGSGASTKVMVARVPKAKLPKALQRLPCDEVEDMLCCYRDYLKPWCA